ncbi:MAG: type II secretion system minor pseudopilin GspK, partial [Oricola sp.]|nr:type II secretion system minor pseudopilin GspK [Oricola sp.]
FEARALAETIGDWIDADMNRRPQGAEDEFYTVLPSPYRAGNQNLASLSELRAVKGVTRELYGTLKPYLCAAPTEAPMKINVNMLVESDAPVLAAALGEEGNVAGAADIISGRPLGGYAKVEEFLAVPAIAKLGAAGAERFDVTSRYMRARAEIVYDTAVLEMTSVLETGGGRARVLARRIGAEE